MTRRSRIVGFGSAGLLVLAGVGCAALLAGGSGEIVALVLISLGFVEAVSLVFLEVGLSEDRERAREEATKDLRRRRDAGAWERARSSAGRPRLDRMRGRTRRLH